MQACLAFLGLSGHSPRTCRNHLSAQGHVVGNTRTAQAFSGPLSLQPLDGCCKVLKRNLANGLSETALKPRGTRGTEWDPCATSKSRAPSQGAPPCPLPALSTSYESADVEAGALRTRPASRDRLRRHPARPRPWTSGLHRRRLKGLQPRF